MSDWIMFALIAVLGVQIPLAVIVHVDAKRLGLENPMLYELGILVPTAGFLVAVVYFSQRSELPRADE